MWPRSLRSRLGLLYALVIAVALGAVLVVVTGLVEQALIQNTADRLELEAGLISPRTSSGGNAPATTLAAADLARILGGQDTAVVIVNGSGLTLASEPNGASAPVADVRLEPSVYAGILSGDRTVEDVLPAPGALGGRVLVVAAPIRFVASAAPGTSPSPSVTPTPTAAPSLRAPGPPSAPPGPGRRLGRGNGRGLGQGGGSTGGTVGAGGSAGATGATGAAPGPPNAVAQLSVSLEAIDATLAGLRGTLIAIGLAALVVAVLVALVLTALGLRPLERVAAVADAVAAGDLSARTGLPSGSDEIGRLGRAFDRMVARVEASFSAQRQFAADASHELRSPLTVLGGYVDVLATGAHEAPQAAGRILSSMRREIDRLSRLAADLLLLTQLEAGGGRGTPQALEVGVVLDDLADAARAIGPDRRIEVARGEPLGVRADPDALTQALLNLVDNAVRHAPPGGLVRLSARRDAERAAIEVFNEGTPIPAHHLPHLFDRFYRADRSAEQGRHAGLGLAIVKAIVESSGGTVSASSDETGTRFVVRLPLAPPPDSQRPLSRPTASLQEARLP